MLAWLCVQGAHAHSPASAKGRDGGTAAAAPAPQPMWPERSPTEPRQRLRRDARGSPARPAVRSSRRSPPAAAAAALKHPPKSPRAPTPQQPPLRSSSGSGSGSDSGSQDHATARQRSICSAAIQTEGAAEAEELREQLQHCRAALERVQRECAARIKGLHDRAHAQVGRGTRPRRRRCCTPHCTRLHRAHMPPRPPCSPADARFPKIL